MAKIPDFSELTKNVQGFVDSVKSAVSGTPPKAPEGDEVAARFVEVMNMVQDLNKAHAEHERAVAAIQNKLNVLYKDVQLLRHPAGSTETSTTHKVMGSDTSTHSQSSPTPHQDSHVSNPMTGTTETHTPVNKAMDSKTSSDDTTQK